MAFGPKHPGPILPNMKTLGGARQQSNDSDDAHAYLWAGRIVHVDSETMVCSIRMETSEGEYHDVPIPGPGGSGPRCWSGNIPEAGTKVVIGWKKYAARGGTYVPYIIEYITTGVFPARDYEPFSTTTPEDREATLQLFPDFADQTGARLDVVRLKLRKAYSGDYLAQSSGGSDILLDKDAHITNRAGNEFRLRDSDQTSILQTINEFTSNSAGYYRRGLIKRNAFNVLPDVFKRNLASNQAEKPDDSYFGKGINKTISLDNPAFEKLHGFGLIKDDGSLNFPVDPTLSGWPGYPYVVTPDGQRISYVVHGEHDLSYSDTDLAYTEDRMEMRHASNGVMSVTEEGDGFQIDIDQTLPYIEDVKGTIVGNDPYSDEGRPFYKKILKMRVFDSSDQASPSSGPKFEEIDMVQSPHEADSMALARLFRIRQPTGNGNGFCYGISKEGRVFIHVPKSLSGEADDKNKSVDLNIQGLVRAIIGSDPNSHNASVDVKLQGGLILDIGKLDDGHSLRVKYAGKVITDYGGDGLEKHVGGSEYEGITGSKLSKIDGSSYKVIGGADAVDALSIGHNAGFGGLKQKSAGDYGLTVLGKTSVQHAQVGFVTKALAWTEMMLAGIDSKTVLVGSISNTVVAGAGILNNVITGSITNNIGAGNFTVNVGTGNMAATVGAGNLALTAGAGVVSITAGISTTIKSAAVTSITSPITKIGVASVGCAVAGVPGPPGPHLDFLTGIPIFGIPTIFIG